MEIELLKTGVFVMLMGMGTVFLFLMVMICMMYINSAVLKYINKYCPEAIDTPQNTNKKAAQNDLAEIAAVIACAINEQRRNNNDRQ